MDALQLTFRAIAEPVPALQWQARLRAVWPAYRRWYLRDGDAARPSFVHARRMLAEHMPELVPTWEALVALAGGGDLAARLLTLYDPPPLVRGCSQGVRGGAAPVLVRNYDFDPARLDAVIAATCLTGRRVIGMSDCVWGLLDGVNEDGLAVALAFGGRPQTGPGFGIPIVVRYLLETCATTAEAVATLQRLPVQMSYNLTMLDRAGAATTVCLAPDRPPAERPAAVATNHQQHVEWAEYGYATRTLQRERRLVELLDDPAVGPDAFVDAFLEPPLYTTDYAGGFGTLYTAAHRPADGSVEYRWPGLRWRQSFAAFEPGARAVTLAAAQRRAAAG